MTLAGVIAPVADDEVLVKYKKRGSSYVPVVGTTEDYQFTSGLTVAQGRFLSAAECDGGRPMCVIGSNLATNLFEGASPLGEKVFVLHHPFEVVGVLEKQGGYQQWKCGYEVIIPLAQFTSVIDDQPDLHHPSEGQKPRPA